MFISNNTELYTKGSFKKLSHIIDYFLHLGFDLKYLNFILFKKLIRNILKHVNVTRNKIFRKINKIIKILYRNILQ